MFAKTRITTEQAGGGALLLRAADELGDYPATVLHSVRAWAEADPDYPLIAERGADGAWQATSYGAAVAAADAIGQALIERGLGPARPLLILSGNSVSHLLVTLGALTAGVPVAPVSVAYSLQSADHARIRAISELIAPGAVYADDAGVFGPALNAIGDVPAITSAGARRRGGGTLDELRATVPGAAVRGAFETLIPDMIAKILFTSGSTGAPKGVLNTHRMLSSNQRMIRQAWPFLTGERPVIVDWLPWSHTFGGNHNVNMMLTNGGTIYVDGGRPAPGLFPRTVANLTDVPPTVYFNVPAGYAQLVPALEGDPRFADRFFSRLRLLFNAAAALPAGLRARLEALAARYAPDRDIPVTGSWGATETAPAVTSANFPYRDARCIGAPLPGAVVKLVPAEDAYEIRVQGPNVTPGYYARPDLTAEAFDADGFYRTGDAVAFAVPGDPDAGLVFRGRIAEDFKLATGTFVRVGAVRTGLLSSVPVLADAVIAGENRGYAAALAWLNPAEARKLLGRDPVLPSPGLPSPGLPSTGLSNAGLPNAGLPSTGLSNAGLPNTGVPDPGAPDGDLATDEALLRLVADALARYNETHGSAASIARLAILARPASLDAGEITDKGYLNQRRVLTRRAGLVELLYASPVPPGVVIPSPADAGA